MRIAKRIERPRIGFLVGASADWGGASRVAFTTLETINRDRFDPVVLLPEEGPIIDRLDRLNLRYVIWGRAHEPRGLISHAGDIARMGWRLRRERIDLLDMNNNFWRAAEAPAARLMGIPIVTHYHLSARESGPYVRFSSAIAAVSQWVADNSGPPSVPKVVIPNSMILDRFDQATEIRAELGLKPEQVVFAFLGQIRDIKGVDLFIQMAKLLPGEHLRFLIAGECRDPVKFPGSYTETRLQAEIAGDKRISYLGYRTDVASLYKSVDVVVAPSRWGEPFALVNLESGAASRPLIATRDGGTPEMLVDGKNGFLIDRDDLGGLVQRARELAESVELRQQLGRCARERVEQRYTTAPVRKLERLYLSLLSRTFDGTLD
ncbi:MAG: glycosyltransferase family 4 protein [Burkholderiales bacterium]